LKYVQTKRQDQNLAFDDDMSNLNFVDGHFATVTKPASGGLSIEFWKGPDSNLHVIQLGETIQLQGGASRIASPDGSTGLGARISHGIFRVIGFVLGLSAIVPAILNGLFKTPMALFSKMNQRNIKRWGSLVKEWDKRVAAEVPSADRDEHTPFEKRYPRMSMVGRVISNIVLSTVELVAYLVYTPLAMGFMATIGALYNTLRPAALAGFAGAARRFLGNTTKQGNGQLKTDGLPVSYKDYDGVDVESAKVKYDHNPKGILDITWGRLSESIKQTFKGGAWDRFHYAAHKEWFLLLMLVVTVFAVAGLVTFLVVGAPAIATALGAAAAFILPAMLAAKVTAALTLFTGMTFLSALGTAVGFSALAGLVTMLVAPLATYLVDLTYYAAGSLANYISYPSPVKSENGDYVVDALGATPAGPGADVAEESFKGVFTDFASDVSNVASWVGEKLKSDEEEESTSPYEKL